jgi:hypothetical protein
VPSPSFRRIMPSLLGIGRQLPSEFMQDLIKNRWAERSGSEPKGELGLGDDTRVAGFGRRSFRATEGAVGTGQERPAAKSPVKLRDAVSCTTEEKNRSLGICGILSAVPEKGGRGCLRVSTRSQYFKVLVEKAFSVEEILVLRAAIPGCKGKVSRFGRGFETFSRGNEALDSIGGKLPSDKTR